MIAKQDFYKWPIRSFVLLVLLSSLLMTGIAVANINEQVAQLDFNTSTLEDVIRIFGEPFEYIWGNQTFTRDNLPNVYIARYPNIIEVVMVGGRIDELRFESPASRYVFLGSISVGTPLSHVLSVVGEPVQTVVGHPCEWEDGVLYKDIDGELGFCYYRRADQNVRFFFVDYRVSALYLTSDVDDIVPIEPLTSINEFDDACWKDLSSLDLSDSADLIATLWFNEATIWPEPNNMPPDCDPNQLMIAAMNPGLGVRELRQQGIAGAGINVAIIDQGMYLDHPEFDGKIAEYYDLALGRKGSMHGPAVASLLVGENCGTAPDSQLYYVACRDGVYEVDYVKALNWLVERNETLPDHEKIRVVSVSAAPGVAGVPSSDTDPNWNEAYAKAEAAGILVLDCTDLYGFIGRCWYDANDPENISKCTPGAPGNPPSFSSEHILVPSSPRTTAEHENSDIPSYRYYGRGGLSWSIPYCAGVMAMGWQINPELTGEQMKDLLFESAYITDDGAKIINPQRFIELVTQTIPADSNDEAAVDQMY